LKAPYTADYSARRKYYYTIFFGVRQELCCILIVFFCAGYGFIAIRGFYYFSAGEYLGGGVPPSGENSLRIIYKFKRNEEKNNL